MKIIARKLGGVYLVQVSRDQGAGERHAPGRNTAAPIVSAPQPLITVRVETFFAFLVGTCTASALARLSQTTVYDTC